MRLKKIKGADEAVEASKYVVHEEDKQFGKWHELFGNQNPIHIEIGMGKGRFLMDLAKQNPQVNYIGIERYSSVLYRALQKMEEEPLTNLFFICMDASTIHQVFAPREVARIYLNFSDPWPKDRHAKRRLTSVEYLKRYHIILTPEGLVEFKTDNEALFDFTLESVAAAGWKLSGCTRDLHHDLQMNQGNVMTEYEERFSTKGNPIYKLIAYR
ncbi:MAG: tRNA (guanosine(46)-N7)-methyltransferase TrmB [Lachnospiraceae bacterium]|nr:tRNA (guanosine(46)-N7)-methyltransferase TrmB [Lachnospiraceae bacterium]